MIQARKHTVTILLVLATMIPIKAQEAHNSFGNCSENTWGYINIYNSSKNIPPVYCSAIGFSEGVSAVKKGEKWGFIDENNKEVIPFDFDYAHSFVNGQAVVQVGEFFGVIDKKGKYVIRPEYYDLQRLEIAGKWYYISRDATFFQGVIDHQGKVMLPHQFTFIIELEGYENVPFYSSFQEVDTSETSFYQQFGDNMYKFGPEKGRHDIYDTHFDKLASKISTDYTDGFQYYQLRRIDQFLKENSTKSKKEKKTEIDRILSLPAPKPDAVGSNIPHQEYRVTGYTLFTNAHGKTGLKKGDSIIIPAQFAHLELAKGVVALAPDDDISYLQESYGGIYRNKEKGILDLFYLMASNNTAKEMSLYNLSGQKILSLQHQKGIAKTALAGITPAGFKYVHLVKDSSGQSMFKQGLVNWKGVELLSPAYQSIQVTKSGELLVKQKKKVESGIEAHFGLYSKTGAEIIPMGIYSNIKAFPQVAHLFLATHSDSYPTAEEKKASEQDNKTQVILKVEDDSYVVVNTFTASLVSRWGLDAESGMLRYRQNMTPRKK